ncbi:glycosyltransferase [Streptomyces sp. NPDC048623]|uniref:glycosyltransferase family 2 protein n=1 Tax=Streptomyces sp. NPDC048623 TaxID=3155761 RepID=UPI003419B15A
MTAPGGAPRLWAVVPAYNEEAGIGATLAALASQTDTDFTLVVVDNASTDATAAVVRRFAATAPFPVHVVHEEERGTGAAADTGFRYAAAHGAELLVRTDADCLPAAGWIAAARWEFTRGREMACGRSLPRHDESPSPAERYLLPALVRATALYGRYRTEHRHPRYRAPYVLCHGHNLAITAALYLRCGGTPRTPLEGPPEDVALLNRARTYSARIARAERMVVHTSLRRLRAWGACRTLLWCWDRRYRPTNPEQVHIR